MRRITNSAAAAKPILLTSLLLALVLLSVGRVSGFSPQSSATQRPSLLATLNRQQYANDRKISVLFSSNDNNDKDQTERLQELGYSASDVQRSQQRGQEPPEKVRVDLVEDVDSFTLTAIGFTLIAINFFVLANLGDGGLGGVVARIINTVNQ